MSSSTGQLLTGMLRRTETDNDDNDISKTKGMMCDVRTIFCGREWGGETRIPLKVPRDLEKAMLLCYNARH